MKLIHSTVAVAAVVCGMAVGLAGQASAQLGEGSYTWTVGGSAGGFAGVHSEWTLTTCGQDCLTVVFSNGKTGEFHLQGDTWTWTDPSTGCTWVTDNNSLAGRNNCPDSSTEYQLTQNG